MLTKPMRQIWPCLMMLIRLAVVGLCCFSLGACDRIKSQMGGSPIAQFNSSNIENAVFGKDFRLTDHNGQTRTLADYRGKVVLMFFGYTQCPDVCPTALARATHVMQQLGADATKLQVLFVTVDPQRDTPTLLKEYVPAFHPSFIGLYGTEAEIQAVAKDYRVFFQKVTGSSTNNYSIDHSAFSYVYDPAGKLRLLVNHDLTANALAMDIRKLL